ncbi:MAG: BNR repeat-containing protein [Bryobacteraceae bacterium]|nr:BNR repeat-containing protein [Bryobacteraceae bacterium]MDW8379955.1 BNR-4 repeat-containing protein [Bryobacterales bacterium]
MRPENSTWFLAAALFAGPALGEVPVVLDGYRGIWYSNQPSHDEYRFKYSGGFATYPHQQSPIAIHVPSQQKTFFCYGGSVEGKQELLIMVSYFDHRTGLVPRPTQLLNKKTNDAHDNPVMAIDDGGHLWIFSNAHGTVRPSYIHRSRRPFDIREFDLVRTTNFSYGHPWFHRGQGFFFLHTIYEDGGRSLYWSTSLDGREWTPARLFARVDLGHYQVTAHASGRSATAFNFHPKPLGLNARTNLYYAETRDLGQIWTTVSGQILNLPLRSADNPALVHNYQAERRLVYLKDLAFEADGHPVILYLTSNGYEAGPKNDPRIWHTARWTGKNWEIREFARSDHNYDFGAIWIEPGGTWRIIAPTEPGPQPYMAGGDMVMWLSRDRGGSWKRVKRLTAAREKNHTYARRPVNAHPQFYALWADGDTKKPSESHLYFTDREGTAVWRLPPRMSGEFAKPERIPLPAN